MSREFITEGGYVSDDGGRDFMLNGVFLCGETAAPAANRLKVWSGSAWAAKPVKVWLGSAWVTKPVKYWNGTAWVN